MCFKTGELGDVWVAAQSSKLGSVIYSFIHSLMAEFNKYLLSTFYVPGTVLGIGDTFSYRKDMLTAPKELTFW